MMKNYLLLLLPFLGMAQVSVVNVTTGEIAFSTYSNKIYATIPSANGANGNSIGVINPSTAFLENTYAIGSEPNAIAISDDGTTVYAGFTGTSTVRKFNVVTNTASIQFPLGSDSFLGPFYCEDIEVMPGSPNTVAVARRNVGFSPKHEGVAIFDNGVMRPTTTQDHTGSNQIEFISPSAIVGYNNETTEFGFRRIAVNAGGATETVVYDNAANGFANKFSVYNNRAYFNDGTVLDFNFDAFVAGTFSGVFGPGVYDPYTNLVCYGSSPSSGGSISFKRYNPETFLLFDSLPIPGAFGEVKSIVVCGNGSYAFNTTDNKVVIINGLLATPSFTASSVSVSPNPAQDILRIRTSETIDQINIYNMLGQKLHSADRPVFTSNEASVDLSRYDSGNYFVELKSGAGTITKKFIKI